MPKHNKPLSGGNNWNRKPDKIKHNKKPNTNPWSQNYGQEEDNSVYGNTIPAYKYSQPEYISPEDLLSPVNEDGQKLANFASRVAVNPWKRQNTFAPPPSKLSFNDDETEAERRLKWELERRGKVGLSFPVYPQNSPLPQNKSNCNCDKEQENDFLGNYPLPRSRTGLSADNVHAWEQIIVNLQQKNIIDFPFANKNPHIINQGGISVSLIKDNKDNIIELSIKVVGKISFKNLPSPERDNVTEKKFEKDTNDNFVKYFNKKDKIDGIKYNFISDFTLETQTNPINPDDIVIYIVSEKIMPKGVDAFVNLLGGKRIYTNKYDSKLSISHELGHILGWQHPLDYDYFDPNIQKLIVPLLFGSPNYNIMNPTKNVSHTQVFPFQYFISYILFQAKQLNSGDNKYNFSTDVLLKNKQPKLISYTQPFLVEYAETKDMSKAYNKYLSTK